MMHLPYPRLRWQITGLIVLLILNVPLATPAMSKDVVEVETFNSGGMRLWLGCKTVGDLLVEWEAFGSARRQSPIQVTLSDGNVHTLKHSGSGRCNFTGGRCGQFAGDWNAIFRSMERSRWMSFRRDRDQKTIMLQPVHESGVVQYCRYGGPRPTPSVGEADAISLDDFQSVEGMVSQLRTDLVMANEDIKIIRGQINAVNGVLTSRMTRLAERQQRSGKQFWDAGVQGLSDNVRSVLEITAAGRAVSSGTELSILIEEKADAVKAFVSRRARIARLEASARDFETRSLSIQGQVKLLRSKLEQPRLNKKDSDELTQEVAALEKQVLLLKHAASQFTESAEAARAHAPMSAQRALEYMDHAQSEAEELQENLSKFRGALADLSGNGSVESGPAGAAGRSRPTQEDLKNWSTSLWDAGVLLGRSTKELLAIQEEEEYLRGLGQQVSSLYQKLSAKVAERDSIQIQLNAHLAEFGDVLARAE